MSPARYAWDQSRLLRMCLSDFRTVHHSQELHLCPSPSQPCSSPYRRAAAVTYTVGTPTEHDLCGLRENFGRPTHAFATRSGLRGPCRSCFTKSNGANNTKKDLSALSSDDEDNNGSRSGSPSWRATPEPVSKRQQQHIPPPSVDDRAPRGRLAGLVAE